MIGFSLGSVTEGRYRPKERKYQVNRMTRCRDMAVWIFFNVAAGRHFRFEQTGTIVPLISMWTGHTLVESIIRIKYLCSFIAVMLLFSILTQRVKMSSIFSYISESSVKLLLVFAALFTFTYLLYRWLNVSHNGGHKLPPALPSLPIVGSLPFVSINMKDLAELGISPSNKLGKIFSLRLGPK